MILQEPYVLFHSELSSLFSALLPNKSVMQESEFQDTPRSHAFVFYVGFPW